MVEYNKCPTCYNYIDDYNEDKSKIERVQGELGLDENGDPLPFWSDDPIYTPLGLSGDDYKGTTIPNYTHIMELQSYYTELEVEILEEENRTEFEEVDIKNLTRHFNIEQLRISIENILNKLGLTLVDYFKYDRHGEETTSTQTEWTDVNRTNKADLPKEDEEGYIDYGHITGDTVPILPLKTIIRAIHIEELRIGLKIGWLETWNPSEVKSYVDFNHTLYNAEDLFGAVSPEWHSPALIGSVGDWFGSAFESYSFQLATNYPAFIISGSATGIFKQDIIEREENNNYISLNLTSSVSTIFTPEAPPDKYNLHDGNFYFEYGNVLSPTPSINFPLTINSIFKFDTINFSIAASSESHTYAQFQITALFIYKGYLHQIVLEPAAKISSTSVQVAHPTYLDSVVGVYDNPEGTGINYYTGGSISSKVNGIIILGTPLPTPNTYVTYYYREGIYPIDTTKIMRYRVKTKVAVSTFSQGFYLSTFENFERNLWDDFNTIYGNPDTFVVKALNFKGNVRSWTTRLSPSNNASLAIKIDNIELK